MPVDDLMSEWLSYPPSEYIRCLVNEMRMAELQIQTATEIMKEDQAFIVKSNRGTEVDLVEIIIRSNQRIEELLRLMAEYATLEDKRGEK